MAKPTDYEQHVAELAEAFQAEGMDPADVLTGYEDTEARRASARLGYLAAAAVYRREAGERLTRLEERIASLSERIDGLEGS